MRTLKYPLDWGSRTFVMGIINITPDSFSGDGLLRAGRNSDQVLEQARQFLAAGADILDIGGESTRPGAVLISEEEELNRVVPVIKTLRDAGIEALISVDTYKASVAAESLKAGADWINDIWGLRADPDMAGTVAAYGAPVVLMHNRSQPDGVSLDSRLGGRVVGAHYADLIKEVKDDLMELVAFAREAGVKDENIILDSGLGFGKTVQQNLELLNRQDEICRLGFPVLLGPSRKSFIGYTLNTEPDRRLEGTAAAVAIGIARGVDIVRVHDAEFMVRVSRIADAVTRPAGQLRMGKVPADE